MNGFCQDLNTLGGTNHRNHADEGCLRWQCIRGVICFGPFGLEPFEIHACREGGDRIRVQVKGGNQFAGDLGTGCEDVMTPLFIYQPAERFVWNGHIKMAAADDQRHSCDTCSHGDQPPIPRAVWINDLYVLAVQPPGNSEDVKRQQIALVEALSQHRHTCLLGTLVKLAVGRGDEPDVAATAAESGHFRQDAVFLPTPAEGGLGVDDAPFAMRKVGVSHEVRTVPWPVLEMK